MSSGRPTAPLYDRQLLLLGAKRNVVLDLWEVLRYGTDSFGDANYVSIYGLPPTEWYARGIRLLGRTVVECTRDRLADAIGHEVAAAAAGAPGAQQPLVIDPFAGSGNTLYWLLRHLPQARGLGCEADPQVFRLTRDNFAILGLPLEVLPTDYAPALADLRVAPDQLIIAFIAPPWGHALQADGLDLRATDPPVPEIVTRFAQRLPNPLLLAIQVYEKVVPASLAALTASFDWSALHVYTFNPAGQNHGVLLLARGWRAGPR